MNRKRKHSISLGLALIVQAAFGVARGADTNAPDASDKQQAIGAVAVDLATSTATVLAIDPEQRTVTLRTADGSEATFHAGKEIINFDQIKVGDEVKATRIDALALYARKPGVPASEGETATVALAPKGAMPGAYLATTVEATDKIVAIDQHKRMVTLEGINGEPRTIHVGPKADLAALKKGDEVVVRLTQGLLLRVENGESEAEPVAAKLPGAIAVETVRTEATVTAVDQEKRTVTLKCPDGSEQTFKAGKDVANFAQIRVGDEVKATLVGELAIIVRKPNSPAVDGETAAIALAPRGTLPGVVMAETEQVTDKIEAINPKLRLIALEEADGQSRIVHVGPAVDLSGLQRGDEVVVRLTEGLALLVEK